MAQQMLIQPARPLPEARLSYEQFLGWLDGPADLVVEIIKPESEQCDCVQKFAEYERGGVREYCPVDPKKRLAECYMLNEEGKYALQMKGERGEYRSTSTVVAGFGLSIEWQCPEMRVVNKWGLV